MIKSIILPDHVQVNKRQLVVPGLPALTLINISGIEDELDNPDLPDRTTHTGGRTKPGEFEMVIPMHHKLEREAMELWFEQCKDPVDPLHKKIGTLTWFSQSNITQVSYLFLGLFPVKRALPDGELDNDGEMAGITWTMRFDEQIAQ